MRNFSILDSTDIIDVILFKYNYYDNKIWTGVKNQIDYLSEIGFIASATVDRKDELASIFGKELTSRPNGAKERYAFDPKNKQLIEYKELILTKEKLDIIQIQMNLETKYNFTDLDSMVDDIIKNGVNVDFKVKTTLDNNSPGDISISIGNTITTFANFWKKNNDLFT